jgi:two-component system LytT family response regulator
MSHLENPLEIVIIDNNLQHSELLLSHFNKCNFPVILHNFHFTPDALNALRDLTPDLIFVNIISNEYSGIEVLQFLPRHKNCSIVYLAANENEGKEALGLGATKFFGNDLSLANLNSILNEVYVKKHSDNFNGKTYLQNKLLINKHDRALIVDYKEILYLEADGPYTIFHLLDKTSIKSSKSLGYYMKLLAKKQNFIKTSRSYLVNFDHIRELTKADSGSGVLVLSNRQEIQFSNNTKNRLLDGIQEIINRSIPD